MFHITSNIVSGGKQHLQPFTSMPLVCFDASSGMLPFMAADALLSAGTSMLSPSLGLSCSSMPQGCQPKVSLDEMSTARPQNSHAKASEH